MRIFKLLATSIGVAALLASCGGGSGSGDQTPAVKYSTVINFGDSLSDAGTYGPGLVNAKLLSDLSKGGQFTVNGISGSVGADPTPSYTWAQLVSAAAIGKVSCAARTGGYGTPPKAVAGCTNYAQGGSRVVAPAGPGNAGSGEAGNINGALTEPVTTQIANYAAASGSANFTGTELITVLAGPNDLFGQTDILTKAATAAGGAAFVTSFSTQLSTGLPTTAPTSAPVAARASIANAFVNAKGAGATDQQAVQAAVQAAALAGNTDVLNLTYINGVTGAAQTAATTAGGNALATSLVTQLTAGLGANAATAAPAIGAAIAAEAAKSTATPNSIVTAAVTAAATDAAVKSYTNANVANAATIGANAGVAANNAAIAAFVDSAVAKLSADSPTPATAATSIRTAMNSAVATASAVSGATSTTILTAAGNAGIQAAAVAGNTNPFNLTYINTAAATATTAANTAGQTYAATTGAANALAGMAQAATDLAAAVKGMIAKGAKYIVVVNIPDVSQTPYARSTIVFNTDGSVKDNSTQKLVLAMTQQFNSTLKTALESSPGVAIPNVVLVDAFSENQRQFADPAHFALTNTKDLACNLDTKVNPLASSVGCNPTNLVAGDTSHYLFADAVHPTPFGHKLLAQYVLRSLTLAGWL